MKLNNIRLAAKLWLVTGLIVLGLCGVTGYTAVRSGADRVAAASALEALSLKTELTQRWAALSETKAAFSKAVLLGDAGVQTGLQEASAANLSQLAELEKSIKATALTPADQAQMAKIEDHWQAVLGAQAKVMQLREKTQLQAASPPLRPKSEAAVAAPVLDFSDALNAIQNQYLPAVLVYQNSKRDLVLMQKQAHESTRLAYAQRAKALINSAMAGMLLLISSIVAGAAWLIRSIRQPLLAANALAASIAQGDLSRSIDTARGDEFGDLMKSLAAMNQSLARMVQQVRQSTDSITTASAEIASGNNDLAQRTEQTSSNLQSTAASMNQLTGTVQQSADNARQASTLAATASSVAQKGGAVVKQVVSTMEEINVSSKKIADIIGVIDGIAFQTNILALNAAVEAARAGEQGRGFAVVASEVRSLAQRSAEAAKEIKLLIGTSVDKVASGTKLVSDAGSTMSDIVQSVRKVADVIGEITAASAEQSSGIAQVNQAIAKLDQMTQQNAALVEQSAAAAESLSDQAGQLAQAVAVFKVTQTALSTPQRRPIRDITPRAAGLAYQRPPQQLPAVKRAPALTSTGAPKPTRKPLAVAPPVQPKTAAVTRRKVDADWETF